MQPEYVIGQAYTARQEARMPEVGIAAIALVMVALKGAFTLLIVYVGARLAIRHERRTLS